MWWKKLFFYPFDLAHVKALILHHRKCTKKSGLHTLGEKVAERFIAKAGRTDRTITGMFCRQTWD
jgi:hypothetical protein